MKELILTYLSVFISFFNYGQGNENEKPSDNIQIDDQRRQIVALFYKRLLSHNNPNIKEYCDIFGIYTLEQEEYKFFEQCENKGNQDCDKLADEIFRDISGFKSLMFSELRNLSSQLLPSDDNIELVISNALILDTGHPGSVELVLNFSNHCNIYFRLNGYEDEAVIIQNIYLTNGESVFNNLGSIRKNVLKRIAIINDPDGYTNVRKNSGSDTSIIDKIANNELFFYVPSSESDWYKVQLIDSCKWGYMHKSRISFYGELSNRQKEPIKEKVKALFEGSIPCY